MSVFDFKAIRERRNHLGGKDIIKEYAQPEPRADWRDDPNVTRLGTVKAGEILTATKLLDLWCQKMAEIVQLRSGHMKPREPFVDRSGVTVEFVNPLAAALLKAAHRAANPPVFVDDGIDWFELGLYGRSPALLALDRIRDPSQDDDPCDECGCDPCECEDDPDEPAYEPE